MPRQRSNALSFTMKVDSPYQDPGVIRRMQNFKFVEQDQRVCVSTLVTCFPSSPNVMTAASKFRSCGGRDQAHSGTVGRRPRTKPENEFLDPPVFIGVGLLFLGIGRGADRGGVEVFEDKGFEAEDGPAGRRVCRCLSRGPSNCQSMPCCFLSCAKFSLRASRSSFDLAIFSGWWYSTAGLS